jgi:hypothetical protein
MVVRSNLVNLDAMIKREDFASLASEESTFETVNTISIRDFTKGGLIGPSLRKPDFQRETNHWSPDQVVSILASFVNGDLIPSVILWQSSTYLFVIDGCHRLSALKAWIEDDYGDGPTSINFFGSQISNEQKKNASKVRNQVNEKIGSWKHFLARIENQNPNNSDERIRLNALITRGLPIQWVKGSPDKAELSFFKINTKGTPLDDIEEMLLKNRNKPISIAARAMIRSGKGHKYWSSFNSDLILKIENIASNLHSILFDPEMKKPIKTLDLPLGGSKGVRTALQVLIDLALIATKNHEGLPKKIDDTIDDINGEATIDVLSKILALAKRITGNDTGSLGLHPAIYFYGPSGRHSGPMFMGIMTLVGRKLSNNDQRFFQDFTKVRSKFENILIDNKDLIATIIQKHISTKRIEKHADFVEKLISHLIETATIPSEIDLVKMSGLEGKIIVGANNNNSTQFSDEIKSEAFIKTALMSAVKCNICQGYLDAEKSISYDHDVRVRDGGLGSVDNCKLVHPYCNQSVKQ